MAKKLSPPKKAKKAISKSKPVEVETDKRSLVPPAGASATVQGMSGGFS
jgi:hypothetical protein